MPTAVLLLGLIHRSALVHDGPVGILQTNPVGAGFDDDGLLLHSADITDDPVDHGDGVSGG